jgi:hypothetical protein
MRTRLRKRPAQHRVGGSRAWPTPGQRTAPRPAPDNSISCQCRAPTVGRRWQLLSPSDSGSSMILYWRCWRLGRSLRKVSSMSLEKEQQLFARAKRELEQGLERIDRQVSLVADLNRDGHDTDLAEEVLQMLRHCHEMQKRHLELLVREIDRQAGESALLEKGRINVSESRRLLSGDAAKSPQTK